MKIFGRPGPDPTATETAELVLTKAQDRRGRLAVQLADAARELDQRKAATADAALNENAVDVADRAGDVATAAATFEALEHAVGVATAEVAKAEQELAAARDAAARAASVHELQGLIDQIEAAAGPFRDALNNLLLPLSRGAEINPDVKNIHGFFQLLRSDVGPMLENASSALAIHARNVEGGSLSAKLPQPAPAPAAVAKTTTTGVLLLYACEWTDHQGRTQRAAENWDIELTPVVAQRAIVSGIAISSDDARAAQKRKARTAINAFDPDRLVNLDSVNPEHRRRLSKKQSIRM